MRPFSIVMIVALLMGTGVAFFACGSVAIERDCRALHPTGTPCDHCLWARCCAPLAACDDDCMHCLRDGVMCSDISNAVSKCAQAQCGDECPYNPSPPATTGAGGTMATATTGVSGAGGK